jgi:glycosyltransferase involved in cell wall biosynthesis
MKTICLNMIVKNESAVIQRCLQSVKHLIDYWVIVDTGSTDETKSIIRRFLKDIPGELHEQSWVSFEQNRNQALALAQNKADYILFIDADETLVLASPLNKSALDKDFYIVRSVGPSADHFRIQLINRHPGWKWKGVVHETMINSQEMCGENLVGATIDCRPKDGHRCSDPDKYLKDAQVLERALAEEPDNARYVFNLAQSYLNAHLLPQALKNFEMRALMPGDPQETFFALFCVGYLQEILRMDEKIVIMSYLSACRSNPLRAEPLERLGNYFQKKGWHLLSYLLGKEAAALEAPREYNTHILAWVYDYSALLLYAEGAERIGKKKEALDAYIELIQKDSLPPEQKKAVEKSIRRLSSGDGG